MSLVTRFAPSPTGELHLGSAYSAWTGWHRAQLRMPDLLDRAREIQIDLRQMPHRLLEIGGIENHLSHAVAIACRETGL